MRERINGGGGGPTQKKSIPTLKFSKSTYIIGHNYHGHYLHAGDLSVNNYVRENKVREVNVRE